MAEGHGDKANGTGASRPRLWSRVRRPSCGGDGGVLAGYGRQMSDWPVVISDEASVADETALRDALYEFNCAATGYRDGRSLSCFLHHDGELVAGIDGFTWGGYARIDHLWVALGQRGHGLGSRMLAAAEDEARRGG